MINNNDRSEMMWTRITGDELWIRALQRERRADLDESCREMIRVSAVCYLGVSYSALAGLALSAWPMPARLFAIALVLSALLMTSLLRSADRQIPVWVLVLQSVFALLLVSIGVAISTLGSYASVAIFYVVIAVYCFHFFTVPIAVAIVLLGAAGYALALLHIGVESWLAAVAIMVGSGLTAGIMTNLLVQRIGRLAAEDALTGLTNRRAWEALLRHEVLNAPRNLNPFSIVLLDLDNFKRINDSHGHIAGDHMLQQVAGALQRVTRKGDVAARWGGDEFALLLLKCGDAEATHIVGRITEQLDGVIDFSVGIETWRPPQTMQDVLEAADAKLYTMKQQHQCESVDTN
ncbi:MAG: GGDEF domain-containing protein [Gammaproteobacteria bacterium]|nr:GGDEF domain-containing protein [Gammaproteobacteria bacterium]